MLLLLSGSSPLLQLVAAASAPSSVPAAPPAPQRILSGSLAGDEMLLAILAEACTPRPCERAQRRVLAVSKFADDMRYSNITPVPKFITGRFVGDVEQALAYQPDLVLLAGFTRPEIIARFKQTKVRIDVLEDYADIEGIERSIIHLGALLGEGEAAARVVASMRAERAAIVQQVAARRGPRPSVMHLYADGNVSGQGTLFHAIAEAAGATNAGAIVGQGWRKLSAEALLQSQPDFLVLGGSLPLDPKRELSELQAVSGLKDLAAVRSGRVIVIPDPELSAVSPHILKAVRRLAVALDQTPPPSALPAVTPSKTHDTGAAKRAPAKHVVGP